MGTKPKLIDPRLPREDVVTMDEGRGMVEFIVKDWSEKYVHTTEFIGRSPYENPLRFLTTFSLLHKERPVPVACVQVKFDIENSTAEITYQFEHDSVRHQYGKQTLAEGRFELWLDRIIRDKMEVRRLHALTTPFEETRLAPPPAYESEGEEESSEEEADKEETHNAGKKLGEGKGLERLRKESLDLTQGLSLADLLSNIFDAADEESEYLLSHKEVANLLYATPLGLKDWDIKLLLTTAPENEKGFIEYKPFVQAAPEIVEALLKRRSAFVSRNKPTATVTSEAIDLCFSDELEEIGRTTREAFNAADPSNTGYLQRHYFKQCLLSRAERFSPQEVQMLMQMVEEDDFGNLPYDDFVLLVQQLRIAALHNALVETDVASLRVHLILLMRREGLAQDLILPIWTIRKVLLSADQLCLSRMQVHVLLSVVQPNEYGWVDVAYFLRLVCTVIPYMFDAATFMEKAQEIAKEKADAQAKAELEELQGLTGGAINRSKKAEDEEATDEKGGAQQMDREGVEKVLVHLMNMLQQSGGGGGGGAGTAPNTLDVMQFLNAMRHEIVSTCQFADHELRGFIAEAALDENGAVNYLEHVKTWIPIIFELRKSRVYDAILAKDWGNSAQLLDLSTFEDAFPIFPHRSGDKDGRDSKERQTTGNSDSKERSDGRRHSKERLSGEKRGSKIAIVRASTRFLGSVMRKDSKEGRGSISKRTRTSMDLTGMLGAAGAESISAEGSDDRDANDQGDSKERRDSKESGEQGAKGRSSFRRQGSKAQTPRGASKVPIRTPSKEAVEA